MPEPVFLTALNLTKANEAAKQAALLNPATMAGASQDPGKDISGAFIICYTPTMITTNGIWQGDNPLDYSLPLFILQAIFVVVTTRGLNAILKHLRQPRFISEVIGGILLGPSGLGRIPNYMDVVFPTRSLTVLETMANLGLVYFIFLVGLQVDLKVVTRAGQKAWVMTAASVGPVFLVEILMYLGFASEEVQQKSYPDAYLIFTGASVTMTAYPVLARILAELKLLNSEIGRLAMSSAILCDGISWILLGIAIAINGKHRSYVASAEIIISGIIFVIFMYYAVREFADWVISQTQEGEMLDELHVVLILLAVLGSAIVADTVGVHAVFGAFVMGVVIPNGPLVVVLTEKLEDFVSGFMLPLFFAVVGVKFEITSLNFFGVWGFLVAVVIGCAIVRVGAIVLVSMFYGMPAREGVSLGVLMNAKGIMELIVLYIALDKKLVYTQTYSSFVLLSIIVTATVTPLSFVVYRQSRQLVSYKRRMIQRMKPDMELRMLACIHNPRNVPSTVSLLEISHPTKRSPVFVCAAHLVELTGRESAMLIVHDTHAAAGEKRRRGSAATGPSGGGNMNRVQAQSEQIIKAFETYEQHAGGVSVQPLTVVSAYSTMHEDICNLAEDKHATLVILPFHKLPTVDGGMEVINPGIRTVNQNVMDNAPCSVGILVDRGLGGTARISAGLLTAHQIAVIFIGGPDDREALAYAARMTDHPGIGLTVLRFLDDEEVEVPLNDPAPEVPAPGTVNGHGEHVINDPRQRSVSMMSAVERERYLDDECVKEFRVKTMSDESVVYSELVVENGEETVAAIQAIDTIHDLYIVGRSEGSKSPLLAGMTDWTENPELGAIGDMLCSADFTSTVVSVLVIQQYRGAATQLVAPDSPVQQNMGNKGTSRATGWGQV